MHETNLDGALWRTDPASGGGGDGLLLRGIGPLRVFDVLADAPKGGSILSRFEGAWWRLLDGRFFFEPARLNDSLSNTYVLEGVYEAQAGSFFLLAESFRDPGHQLALDGVLRPEQGQYLLDCLFIDEGSESPILRVTQRLTAGDTPGVLADAQTIKGVPAPALYDLELTGATTSGSFSGIQACLYTVASYGSATAVEPDDVHFNVSHGSVLEASEDKNGTCTLLPPLKTFMDAAAGVLPSQRRFAVAVEDGRMRLDVEDLSAFESIFSWVEVDETLAAADDTPRPPLTFCEARNLSFECRVSRDAVSGEIGADGLTPDGRAARYEATFKGRRAEDAPQTIARLERKARQHAASRSWRDTNVFDGEWQSDRFGSVRLRQDGADVNATFSAGADDGFTGTATEHRLIIEAAGEQLGRCVFRAVRGGQFLAGFFSPPDEDSLLFELLYRAESSSRLVEDTLLATPDALAWDRLAGILKSLNRHGEALAMYEKIYQASSERRRRVPPYSETWTWFLSCEWGALLNLMNCFQMRQLLKTNVHPRFRVGEEGEEAAFSRLLNAMEYAVELQAELQHLSARMKAEEGVEFPDFGARLTQQIEMWRRSLGNEAGRMRALEAVQPSLAGLIRVLLAAGSYEQALVVAESARARAFSDLMQTNLYHEQARASLASLASEDVERLLAGTLASTAPVELQALRQTARSLRSTIVEYYLGNDDLLIWVISPGGEINFHRQRRARMRESLTNLVALTRAGLGVQTRDATMRRASHAPERYLQPLAELYGLLVSPIARWLPASERDEVIFIPHETLFLVPFPALFDQQYLVERHTISVAPSIHFVETTHQLAASRQEHPSGLLVVGDPLMPVWRRGRDGAAERLPQLAFSRKEAEQIAAKLKTVALTGAEATRERVVAALPVQNLVHFATHGLIEDDATADGIPGAIALASSGEDDGFLTASQIAALNLRARMVVMSACNTGRGRLSADGVVGLARAFLTAGAECVVASLWAVGDQSTQELMVGFYEHLLSGQPAAQALRQAMLTLKAEGRYNNPLHWAGFIVTGQCREPLFDVERG